MRNLLDSLFKLTRRVSRLAPLLAWFTLVIIVAFTITGSMYFVNESRIVPAVSILPLIVTALGILITICITVLAVKQRSFFTTILKPKYVIRFSVTVSILIGLCVFLTSTGSLEYLYDSALLVDIAKGSGSVNYLSIFPHNIPLVLLMRLLVITVGSDYIAIAFMLLNTLSVALVLYAVYKITDRLFHNDTATTSAILLAFTFIPFVYYIPHLYGDLSGIALTLFGFYFAIKTTEKSSPSNIAMTTALLSIALLLKGNTSLPIIIIAMSLFGYGIYRKNPRLLVGALVIPLVSLSLQSAVISFGQSHYSLDRSKELPKTVWIAMGLKYGDRETPDIYPRKINPGTWAPGITGGTILGHAEGLSTEQADRYAKSVIKEELSTFLRNPLFAFDFFTQKIVATWNNQSFEGPDRLGYRQKNPDSGIYNNSSSVSMLIKWISKVHQQIIYLLVAIALVYILKNRSSLTFPVGLTLILFITGFALSMAWEVMSRSVLSYYFLLLPLVGLGFSIIQNLSSKIKTEKS